MLVVLSHLSADYAAGHELIFSDVGESVGGINSLAD